MAEIIGRFLDTISKIWVAVTAILKTFGFIYISWWLVFAPFAVPFFIVVFIYLFIDKTIFDD